MLTARGAGPFAWPGDGLERVRQMPSSERKIYPSQTREYQRRYYALRRDYINARERERRKGPKRREYEKQYNKRRWRMPHRRNLLAAWLEAHPEKRDEYNHTSKLRNKYGMTGAEYEELFASQGGVCAICRNVETVVRRGRLIRLSVDHCHITGRVRGLLCSACNAMLGSARDIADTLRAAAVYLERHAPSAD